MQRLVRWPCVTSPTLQSPCHGGHQDPTLRTGPSNSPGLTFWDMPCRSFVILLTAPLVCYFFDAYYHSANFKYSARSRWAFSHSQAASRSILCRSHLTTSTLSLTNDLRLSFLSPASPSFLRRTSIRTRLIVLSKLSTPPPVFPPLPPGARKKSQEPFTVHYFLYRSECRPSFRERSCDSLPFVFDLWRTSRFRRYCRPPRLRPAAFL